MGKSEKINFNSLLFHLNNDLISNQSGFKPGDSCIHQLISITHDIYKGSDVNPSFEVRGVSSNINELIRAVLNSLFFFTKRFCTHQKAPKAQKAQKVPKCMKTQPSKNTKTQMSKQK